MERLPENWKTFLAGFADGPALADALLRLEERRKLRTVFPPSGSVFRAFELTAPEKVRAVIVGQDPYHEPGQAQGLAFSVPAGTKLPPSLKNILGEYCSDTGYPFPASGDLTPWARAGVLLLNTVLTVDSGCAASHAKRFGWENFSDAVIRALSAKRKDIAFILWGNFAASKRPLIDERKHLVISSAHPSPLSARRGFFGSKPFSQAASRTGIDWRLEP